LKIRYVILHDIMDELGDWMSGGYLFTVKKYFQDFFFCQINLNDLFS